MALSDVFAGLKDVLNQTGEFTKDVMGSVNDIKNVFDPQDTQPTTNATGGVTGTPAAYDLNLKWSDLGFTPNWTLLGGGAALLVVALVLMAVKK